MVRMTNYKPVEFGDAEVKIAIEAARGMAPPMVAEIDGREVRLVGCSNYVMALDEDTGLVNIAMMIEPDDGGVQLGIYVEHTVDETVALIEGLTNMLAEQREVLAAKVAKL
jgi:hypothetical protein